MILLSFDIEEFDMPFEYHKEISFKDQMDISIAGTEAILDILEGHQVKATFFSTVIFAQNAPATIQRILDQGHELASHGYYHSDFKVEHLLSSRLELEKIIQAPVTGYRMARMQPTDDMDIQNAGYEYNSSINPTWLPGRYNNLHLPRTHFKTDKVLQIPASVTPLIRFPLFWLSFHNLPLWLYTAMARWTIKTDGYLNVYFHPWEFTDLDDPERFGFPGYVRKNTGVKMISRMDQFIHKLKQKNAEFVTIASFVKRVSKPI